MSDRILDADMRTIGRWIAGGTRWWLDQLGGLVPERWRGRGGARMALAHYDPALGVIDFGNDLSGRAVVIPDALCLIRRIERPQMNDRDLAAMIALDAQRLMPLAGAAMIVAGRAQRRDAADGAMIVELAGLPLADAETLSAQIARQGGAPLAVLVGDPGEQPSGAVDLLPELRRAGLLDPAGQSALRWWLVIGMLFLLNLGILIWRDVAATDNLADVVAAQQPAVDAARRIRARIAGAERTASRTLALRDVNEPLAMLTRVAVALPPGVWLQRYSWQEGGLKLAGYRPAKADVTGALRTAGLGTVRYAEDTASAATPMGQPFEITAKTMGSR